MLSVERADFRIEQYSVEAARNFTESFFLNLDKLWLYIDLPHKQALQAEIFRNNLTVEKGEIRISNLACTFKLLDNLNAEEIQNVTQTFLNWNQIRASLEQWKHVLQPESPSASLVNYQ